jgi:hypothetical protein
MMSELSSKVMMNKYVVHLRATNHRANVYIIFLKKKKKGLEFYFLTYPKYSYTFFVW